MLGHLRHGKKRKLGQEAKTRVQGPALPFSNHQANHYTMDGPQFLRVQTSKNQETAHRSTMYIVRGRQISEMTDKGEVRNTTRAGGDPAANKT